MSTTTTLFGSTEAQAARDLIGGTAIGDLRNDLLKQILVATANRAGGSGGSGTVTSFSFTNGAGISGVVTNPTTTPALALTLGAIAPTSVNGLTLTAAATGFTIAGGTTSKTLTVQNTLSLAGADSSVLTIPATGTAALLGTANVFTAAQTISTTNTCLTLGSGAGNAALALRGTGATALITVGYGDSISIGVQILANNGISITGGSIFGRNASASLFLPASGQMGFGPTGDNIGTNDTIIARKAAAALQLGVDAAGVTNQMFTAASRITSDGVGANLTIAGGNGRGGAGGSLIFSTYTTEGAGTIGTLTTRWTVAAATGDFIPGLNATYSIGNNDSNCYKVFSSAFYSGILQVVGPQEAAVADATGGATVDDEARTAINSLLARMRSHGLIAN